MVIRKLSKSEKSRSFIFFLKIVLPCLICFLSLLDAPEYVHCTHLGVCEFLEIHGNMKPSQEAENILSRVKKAFQHSSYFYTFFVEYYPFRSQRCGDLTFSQVVFKNVDLSVPFYILSRYFYPDYKKILCIPCSGSKGQKIKIKQQYFSPTTNKSLPSQSLQLISTSIINS